jgi:lipid II isoglutaminyl synthase (glutamine-hydrolysing)
VSARQSAVRVGLVYPELLGTYGDRGNAVVLVQRCLWRGIPAELVEVSAGTPIPDSLDVYLFGGGEDDPQAMAAAGMLESRAAVERAWHGGAAVLAVCAGFQLIGHRYDAADGSSLEGLALVDAVTRAGSSRLIGEVVIDPAPSPFDAPSPALPRLTGFENHGGRTTLGAGVAPLGRVVTGGGNSGESGPIGIAADGARAERLIGTYLHGPVLPRNPALADLVLGWVCGSLDPLASPLEEQLHDERLHAGTATGLRKWWQNRALARG